MSMLDSYSTKPRQKRMMMSMFAMYPLLGLLNLAVSYINVSLSRWRLSFPIDSI